jgi:hypothetical protein
MEGSSGGDGIGKERGRDEGDGRRSRKGCYGRRIEIMMKERG